MPVRYLSDPELARLSSWPDEIAVKDAVTYFTLSADELSWLAGFNRQQNRLGVAVQLSTLPWLGWIPDDLAACPPFALDRLALALAVAPDISSAIAGGIRRLAGTNPQGTPGTGAGSPELALVRRQRTQAAGRVPAGAGARARCSRRPAAVGL